MGSFSIPVDIATRIALAPTPAAPPDCSWWDFFANPTKWSTCEAVKEQAQIQSVPQRAAAYGYPAPVVQAAQQAADQQSAQTATDVGNVSQCYEPGTLIATPCGPGSEAQTPTWVIAALLVGGVLLIGRLNA